MVNTDSFTFPLPTRQSFYRVPPSLLTEGQFSLLFLVKCGKNMKALVRSLMGVTCKLAQLNEEENKGMIENGLGFIKLILIYK